MGRKLYVDASTLITEMGMGATSRLTTEFGPPPPTSTTDHRPSQEVIAGFRGVVIVAHVD